MAVDIVNNETAHAVRERLVRAIRRLDAPDSLDLRVALDVAEHDWNRYQSGLSRLIREGVVIRERYRLPRLRGGYSHHTAYRLADVSLR